MSMILANILISAIKAAGRLCVEIARASIGI